MGTDIFLSWDGMPEQDKRAQAAVSREYNLVAGEIGYIRAAIGMRRENGLLGFMFPDEYWFNKTGEPIPFDFAKTTQKLKEASAIYLRSVNEDSAPEFGQAYQRAVALDVATMVLRKRKGYEMVAATKDLMGEDAVAWMKSVGNFFGLGLRLQMQGKNPTITISW